MTEFKVPTIEEVSPRNQEIFQELKGMYGDVPNIFAAFASSENGLETYFHFLKQKNSLTEKEKEVVNLVVSQVNECPYCLSFHTAMAKRLGLTNEEILSIRSTEFPSDNKLNALAKMSQNIAMKKGHVIGDVLEDFYEMGYDQGNLVDVVLAVGNITTLNMLYAITEVPIDWPKINP